MIRYWKIIAYYFIDRVTAASIPEIAMAFSISIED